MRRARVEPERRMCYMLATAGMLSVSGLLMPFLALDFAVPMIPGALQFRDESVDVTPIEIASHRRIMNPEAGPA